MRTLQAVIFFYGEPMHASCAGSGVAHPVPPAGGLASDEDLRWLGPAVRLLSPRPTPPGRGIPR
ncbi:MAG TPA: hypothetical protein VIJ51_01740 [Solirubrobacteraceae bacterium]